MLKKYLSSILYFFTITLTSTLVITILNYFNILPPNIINILKLLIPIVSISIASYILGKNSKQKGYIEGIKFGTIILIILALTTTILDKITIKSIIYYIILLLCSIIASMIGINQKNKNQ